MSKTFLTILLSGLISIISAQHCGFEVRAHQHTDQATRAKVEQKVQKWIQTQEGDNLLRSVITLPVVVHVLYRNDQHNISDAQIKSQLDVLNEDFRASNLNLNQTPTAFEGVIADIEIEFCLVKKDSTGAPHSGINRMQTQRRNIGLTENFFKSSLGGIDLWDPERYINIYICELGRDLLGFATVPSEKEEFDGIVVQPQYFGRIGTATSSVPNHLGRTLTHEMGHYLGLEHLWGIEGSSCSEGDFVDDTPPQEEPSYGCPNYPLRDICSPGREGLMFMNYMDYSDDECMTMFSLGQKKRMLAQLELYRSGLLQFSDCETTASKEEAVIETSAIYNSWTDEICVETSIDQSYVYVTDIQGRKVMHKHLPVSGTHCWHWAPNVKGLYTLQIRKSAKLNYSTIFVVY